MPSKAYETFQANLEQADRILDPHKVSPFLKKRGRRKMNHINRSALIILCASWEQYIEDVALESVEAIIACTDKPRHLPHPVQKNICATIAKHSKNNLELLESAITGNWKKIYRTCAQQAIDGFNSPKCKNINVLLNENIGVTCRIFSDPASSQNGKRLDGIINIRNMIAHRGVERGPYIGLKKVTESTGVISKLAKDTDDHLYERLTEIYSTKIPLWNGKVE